jgi:DNA-binding Lrp family transcriptional regulator
MFAVIDRRHTVITLDPIDSQILQLLATDGRIPNSALAARVGIAPSTCLNRVRSLRERGILRGFAADIDPSALGYPIQAMVSVRMQPHARDQLTAFMDGLLELPLVLNAYLLGGNADFLIHVAAASVERLRELVIDELNSNPAVAATETNLIFKYLRARRIPISSG